MEKDKNKKPINDNKKLESDDRIDSLLDAGSSASTKP